eukprot:675418-Pleurochrysis_carterae.AAC.1
MVGVGRAVAVAVASSSCDGSTRGLAVTASVRSPGEVDGCGVGCWSAVRVMRVATAFAISMFRSGR